MGGHVINAAKKMDGVRIKAGLDQSTNVVKDVPVVDSLDKAFQYGAFNMVLDFSKPAALDNVLRASEQWECPLVIATTGHSPEQQKAIEAEAKKRAILKSTNFSMSVFKWVKACAAIAAAFKDNPEVDIEIMEAHHNRKADGPSGTAKTVAEAILKARGWGQIVDRTPDNANRQPGDIGLSFMRGGNVPGYHEVCFFSPTGELRINEREYGREGFAAGALDACKMMNGKKSAGRLYTLDDLVK